MEEKEGFDITLDIGGDEVDVYIYDLDFDEKLSTLNFSCDFDEKYSKPIVQQAAGNWLLDAIRSGVEKETEV